MFKSVTDDRPKVETQMLRAMFKSVTDIQTKQVNATQTKLTIQLAT